MSNKIFLIGLSSFFVLLISPFLPAQTDTLTLFSDDFESFTAGQQLVCQDSINWHTWSLIPCDSTEDPYVVNTIVHGGSNSVWINQNNDLVKPIPDYTSGKYRISFYMYVPQGYTASWGQLAAFYNPDSTEWGFYAMFNPYGNGNINAGGWGTAQFSFSYDIWMHNELIVDLIEDSAEYYFQGNLIHSWKWTLGSSGDTIPRQLSATDIMGSDWPSPDSTQWYIDDYELQRLDTTVGVKGSTPPQGFILDQNYPNPFNPRTIIKYSVPQISLIQIKVFDVLGNETKTLVSGENPAGTYELIWNAEGFPSGVYFYQLKAGKFIETKKMILMK